MKKNSPHLHAIFYALAGYAFWVGADSFIKLASAMPAPKYEVVGVAALAGMLMLYLVAALRGRLGNLRPRHYRGLAALGFLMILTYLGGVVGLRYLPLADFYAIVFMAPLVVACLAARLFHERMEWQKIAATLAGFGGVLIAVGVFSFRGDAPWIGYAFAFLCMLVTASQQLIMRFLGDREHRECTAFYPRLGPVLACGLACLIGGVEPMPAREWLYAIMTGAIGSLGWLCVAEAYRHAPAATVAPYQYTQIVSGGILGYAIWNDVPPAHLLLGAGIIVIAGIYIAYHTHRSQAVPAVLEL